MKSVLRLLLLFIFFPAVLSASWVDVDGTGTAEVLIYPSLTMSSTFSIKYDSLGYPHVLWSDSGLLYYLKYNGSAWVDADGTGQANMMIGSGDHVKLNLDSADRAHVVWIDYVAAASNYDVFYMKWNGSSWVDADGTGTGNINITNSPGNKSEAVFAVDSAGRAHVAFVNQSGPHSDIFYLKWNGSAWVDADGTGTGESNVSNSLNLSSNPDIEIDASDNPHIVYSEASGGLAPNEIYYIRWNSTAWTDVGGSGVAGINISNDSDNSVTPDLDIDVFGYPHVAWLSDRNMPGAYNRDVFYLKWNGSVWVDADGTGTGNINITGGSIYTAGGLCLDTDAAGKPCLAWTRSIYNAADSPVGIYYAEWGGSSWTDPDGFTTGMTVSPGIGTSLDLDPSGRPGIMFMTGGAWAVAYTVSFLQWSTDFTPTPTVTATQTETSTPTASNTQTETPVSTPVFTQTITWTVTASPSMTITQTCTPTPSITQTATCTPTITPTTVWTDGEIEVFPNPFNINSGTPLKFINVPINSIVHIYTVSVELVWTARPDNPVVLWYGLNRFGKKVSPGIYYYLVIERLSGERVLSKGRIFVTSF